jgi:Rrf2 family protein
VKITYKGDYALKAILELSVRYEDNKNAVIPINEIAKFGDMPKKFLEQILLTLVRGGLVKSKRGAGGGFTLSRPPENITVGDVIRLIEGPIEPIECVNDGYKGCADVKSCILRSVWKEVAGAISIVVDTLTFKELVLRYKERNAEQNFEYVI